MRCSSGTWRSDVATIGVPDAEWGEEIEAIVELRPGIAPALRAGGRAHRLLPRAARALQVSRSVDFETLPRHDTGRLFNRLLRDRYRQRSAGAP
jgi:acyl-CoA synthetase (AMP-forming)/AMP-acid ligase II